MFDENVSGAPGAGLNAGVIGAVRHVSLSRPVKLSEEEAIEFLSNWNLCVAYTLLEKDSFLFNAVNVAQKLNILVSEADHLIKTLINMKLIEPTAQLDKYTSQPMIFDDSFIASADCLNIFSKLSGAGHAKLTSKDLFNSRFEILSHKVIQRYLPEFADLVARMVEESKSEADCEVYNSNLSFIKATRTRKEK
jgi:hypothetical protein